MRTYASIPLVQQSTPLRTYTSLPIDTSGETRRHDAPSAVNHLFNI